MGPFSVSTLLSAHRQWRRQSWAWGLVLPQCRLAATMKHTGQESGGGFCEIFKC